MSIRKKVIKKIILVLEGCVVWLKEIEANLTDADAGLKESVLRPQSNETIKKNVREDYVNISVLDNYYRSNDLPLGLSFAKLIQRIEINTELSIVNLLIESIESGKDITTILDSITVPDNIQFKVLPMSPLRPDEDKTISRAFIENELAELKITSNGDSLYKMCLDVIEAKQKATIQLTSERFSRHIEALRNDLCNVGEIKEVTKKIFIDELTSRKRILEIKHDR